MGGNGRASHSDLHSDPHAALGDRRLTPPGRGGRRRLQPGVARHFRRVPGWRDDVAESEEEAGRRQGAGEAPERAVTAAARRSQRLGPGPVCLSAPRGCESAAAEAAAAAAEEESVGRRRAGGSAEDEAAAGRSRRGGGRRAVAAAAAQGPGGRARAHGEKRPRPARQPPPAPPPRQARRGLESPAAGPSPEASRGRLPVGPGGAGTPGAGRRHFRELPGRDSAP